MLNRYLSAMPACPRRAVIAVAGPVFDGNARMTNLSWDISASTIQKEYGFESVVLLNDLEAMAWAIPLISPDGIEVLQVGDATSGGTIALLAPGTGLGAAFLTWNGAMYEAHSTEGGHADFAPCNEEQARLLAYLREKFGHVSVERVCSGLGLASIYQFLRQDSSESEHPSIQSKLEEADDITPVIVAAALAKESSICTHAVRMFADSLAAEAGSFALRVKAEGGIYLGGGLLLHVLPFLQSAAFIDQFASKGRFSEFLRRVPLAVLRDPLSAVRGAAQAGLRAVVEPANDGGQT